MQLSLLKIPIICVILIAPLVVFQGKPETTPDFLTTTYMGVPGTVLATTAWFFASVFLTWYVGKMNVDHLDEDDK